MVLGSWGAEPEAGRAPWVSTDSISLRDCVKTIKKSLVFKRLMDRRLKD